MNKVSRILTMVGMGLMAGVAIGAGPAQASGTTTTPAAKPASAIQNARHFGGDLVVGYYRSPRACRIAGDVGERFNRWDEFRCVPVGFGFRHGEWALTVEHSSHWNRGHDRGHGRGHDRGHDRGHHNH